MRCTFKKSPVALTGTHLNFHGNSVADLGDARFGNITLVKMEKQFS